VRQQKVGGGGGFGVTPIGERRGDFGVSGIRDAGMFGTGFSRGNYNPIQEGMGADHYNAFLHERSYAPRFGGGGGGGGGAPPPPAPPQGQGTPEIEKRGVGGVKAGTTPPPRATGFGPRFDPGYDPEPVDANYQSERARRQAQVLAYGIGYSLGQEILAQIEEDDVDADLPSLASGFSDGVVDADLRLTEAEISDLLHELYERVAGAEAAERLATDPQFRAELERNEATAEELAARLAADPDVVTMDNGLQYKVIVAGDGPTPQERDMITVRYRLLDTTGAYVTDVIEGRVIVRQMLEGTRIALKMMPVGSTWRIAIPSSLAHGSHGKPPHHGPGVTLYYEVELVAIH
jgi:FKBP-type peptidyl-prolyl cis-trans isomerase FklB